MDFYTEDGGSIAVLDTTYTTLHNPNPCESLKFHKWTLPPYKYKYRYNLVIFKSEAIN
jgi:hypothetical protein